MYLLIIIIVFSNFISDSNQDNNVITAIQCRDQKAFNIRCFGRRANEITNGGTVRRDEPIVVWTEMIPGACDHAKPSWSVIFIPPFSTDDSADNVKRGTLYTNEEFSVRPYSIQHVGKVILKVFLVSFKTKIANPETCELNVVYTKPQATLEGGSQKYYAINKDTFIIAEASNFNNMDGNPSGLTYTWGCSVIEGSGSKFCKRSYMAKFEDKHILVLPAKVAKRENVFQVVLEVGLADAPNITIAVGQQVFYSQRKLAKLSIQCVKNCAPKSFTTLPTMPTILKAICEKCRFGGTSYLHWTIVDLQDQETVDYAKLKSRRGDQFYLQPGALEMKQKYIAKVRLINNDEIILSAEIKLNTRLPPPVKECVVIPTNGVAFQTGFQVRCAYMPDRYIFQLFAVQDGTANLLLKNTHLRDMFMLPAGASLMLNATDEITTYTQSIELNVQVEKCLDIDGTMPDLEISRAVRLKLDEAVDLIKEGYPELGLQGLAAVVQEYSDLPSEKQDVIKSLDMATVNTLKFVGLTNPTVAQQVADILSQISGRYNESDPNLTADITAMCYKASKVLNSQINQAGNPESIRAQITQGMKSLAGCSQSGLHKNPKAIEAPEVMVNVTPTKHPLLPGRNPTENYPDYTDDEKSSDNMALYEKSTVVLKNICFSNAKMLTSTMIPEEDPIVIRKDSLVIVAEQVYCYERNRKNILTEDVSIKLSKACLFNKIPVVDILCCYTYNNPYWYADNVRPITPFVFVRLTDMHVEHWEKSGPFQITLAVDDIKMEFKPHQAVLPDKSFSEMSHEVFYDKLSIHRIFVLKNAGFSVKFENMTEEDEYEIVISRFEKPTYRFFKTNRKLITFNNSIVDIGQVQLYDSFWFLSVLPNEEMKRALPLKGKNYSFSVTTAGCYTWNETSRHWELSCYSKTGIFNSSSMTCYCQSGQVFTGYIRNNKVNLEATLPLEFALELRMCWIVYATVIATYLAFGIVLFLTSFEKPHDILDKVFFVGDVPSPYQYTYIIIITTGKKRGSGTTSNITIKLYGSTGNSLEHVLNYPDPELAMLQRHDETVFILATDSQLGEIENIELWFDSIGNNSKWYCSKIEIHDIQADRSWLFKVEAWFDLIKQDQSKYSFKPFEAEPLQVRTTRLISAIKSLEGTIEHEVNLWNLLIAHPLLMRKERATLIFSSVILMYLLILVMYLVPSFSETDMIDEYSIGFHYALLWSPILGGVATFLVHFPLIYYIKRGNVLHLKSRRLYRIASNNVTSVCWTIVIINSTFATAALIVCGFWVPLNASLLWLVSVVLGIVFNIVVLQTISTIVNDYLLKSSGQAEAFKSTMRRIIQYVELQRVWIYKRFGKFALRPYLRHLYFPLDYLTAKDRFKWQETKRTVESILKDLVIITLYVSLLYIVLIIDKEPQSVDNYKEIRRLVLGEVFDQDNKAKSISTLQNFISATLLPSIQAIHWYGKFLQDDPGMMKDFSNRYLGIVRLRQHRTQDVQCDLPKALQSFNTTCRPDFSALKDFKSYSRGWKPATDISNITTERMGNVWKYVDDDIAGTSVYLGDYGFYPGGGYVAPLGRTLKNSLINMKYLEKHDWLDIRTRALFIEVLTYNPNVNLFNSISLIFEFNAVGHLIGKPLIQTRKFLMVDRHRILTINVVSTCFALMILALIVRIVYKILKSRVKYFYDLWSIFDIVIVLLSAISVYLYYVRLRRIYRYISTVSKAKNNEFVNYFHLFNADNALTALTAVLVFVSTLRLWKLLRFMVIIKIAEKTLSSSWKPLLICAIYQMVYMIAFSLLSMLFFSAHSKDFRDFHSSFTSLLLLGLGLFYDFESDTMKEHFLGVTFYTLYMMFSLFFLTVYIAIINIYYAEATDYYADEQGFVQKYIGEKWVYYKTLLKVRAKNLRGGQDLFEDLVIKPKSGNRYEDCMTIPKNRLSSMALVTMCVLRNLEGRKTMEDKDFALISRTIKAMFSKESAQKEVFFTTTNNLRRTEFVDDRRIKQIADISERLAKAGKNIPQISIHQREPLINERLERINNIVNNIKIMNSILHNIEVKAEP